MTTKGVLIAMTKNLKKRKKWKVTEAVTGATTPSLRFSPTAWAVMFILACEGQSYARLRFNVGPCGEIRNPKLQISNKSEITIPKARNGRGLGSCFGFPALSFEFVSGFDIRI